MADKSCPVTIATSKRNSESVVFEQYRRAFNKPTDLERFRPHLEAMLDVMDHAKSKNVHQIVETPEQMAKNIDELTRELTLSKYESFDDMVNNAPEGFNTFFTERLQGKMASYASLADDPDAFFSASNTNKDFRELFNFYYKFKNKSNRTLLGLIPMTSKWKTNLCIGNFQMTFKQHKKIYEKYAEGLHIGTSISRYTSTAHEHIQKMAERHISDVIRGSITASELSALMLALDPSQSAPELIGLKIDDKWSRISDKIKGSVIDFLETNGRATSDEIVGGILRAMRAYETDWTRFNYGVDDMSDFMTKDVDADGVERTVISKDYYKMLQDKNMNALDTAVQMNGKSQPALLRMMTVMGGRVTQLLPEASYKNHTIKAFADLFNNMGNRELGGFVARAHYMPGSGGDDVFESLLRVGSSGDKDMIFFDTDILRERETLFHLETGLTLVDAATNNLKAIRHMFSKVSQYAAALSISEQVKSERSAGIGRGNEAIEDIHNTAAYWSDKLIDRFHSGGKQLSPRIMAYKKWANAALAMVAGSILTTSGVTNRIAGAMTRSMTFGFTDTQVLKNQYNDALASTGEYNELAKAIEFEFDVYRNEEKLSDFLLSRSNQNYTNSVEYLGKLGSEIIPNLIQKMGERSMTHVLGLVKMGTWNFNDSENQIVAIRKHYAFNLGKLIIDADRKSGKKTDIRELNSTIMRELRHDTFTKAKEAVGAFEASAKPFWSTELMQDPRSGLQVLLGTAIAVGSMFKSVMPVNMETLHRLTSGLTTNQASVSEFGGYTFNRASAAAIIGLTTYGLLEKLLEDEMPFRMYTFSNINPAGEMTDVAFAGIAAIEAVMNNGMVTERGAQHINDFARTVLGILSGGAPRFQIDDGNVFMQAGKKYAEITNPTGWHVPYLNPFTFAKDITESITSGIFSNNDDKYKFISDMAGKDYAFLFNNSNKYYKYSKDLLAITNFAYRGWTEDKNQYYADAAGIATGDMLNILNATWRVPRDPYRSWFTANSIYHKNNELKRLNYLLEKAGKAEAYELQKNINTIGYDLAKSIGNLQKFRYTNNRALESALRESTSNLQGMIRQGKLILQRSDEIENMDDYFETVTNEVGNAQI